MLTIHRDSSPSVRITDAPGLPDGAIWLDLLNPTADERAFVETHAGMRVPSVEALSEIESSSRLIAEKDVLYLSTPVVASTDPLDPFLSPAGFVLSEKRLVTIRFTELSTFSEVAKRVEAGSDIRNSAAVFITLLEAMVDRGADVLERLGSELDKLSRSIFRGDVERRQHTVRSNRVMRRTLGSVGTIGDRMSQARDVLLGLGRIASFVERLQVPWIGAEIRQRLASVSRDITSLDDYQAHLSDKVQFMLDATLGFINISQNDLFKVLTVVSVIGIPPTLVAGIYGMNFKIMPELNWAWGYPFGLTVIVLSAVLPYLWFKWRGWL